MHILDEIQASHAREIRELRQQVEMAEPCEYMTHPGSRYVDPCPPEFCDEDALPGSRFCALHEEDW